MQSGHPWSGDLKQARFNTHDYLNPNQLSNGQDGSMLTSQFNLKYVERKPHPINSTRYVPFNNILKCE